MKGFRERHRDAGNPKLSGSRHSSGFIECSITRYDSQSFALVEGPSRKDAQELCGRSENNRVVNFASRESDLIGRFIDVEITQALHFSLRGVPLAQPRLRIGGA